MNRFMPETIGDERRLQRISAAVALIIAAGALVGTVGGVDLLMRWLPGSSTMNPITATLLVLGGALFLLGPKAQRIAMPAVAAIMIAAGALKLGQVALGHPLGIDQLAAMALMQDKAQLPDAIALNTALAFILLGLALAIGRTARPMLAMTAQAMVIAATAIAVMALAGFVLDAAAINQLTFNRMAVNTASAVIAFGLAVLTLNPAQGVMRLLLGLGATGRLARKALPICLAVPILLGVIRLWLQRDLGLTTGDGVAIMVAGNIALSLGLLWGSLILLAKSDSELRAYSVALEVSEAQYRQAGRVGKMGHWHFDLVHQQLHWTNEFRALLDLDAAVEPDFRVMDARIHPDDREQARELMNRAKAYGEDWNWQLRLVGPDGEIRYAQSHGICHRAPDGSLDSILGVLADVTDLVEARRDAEAASMAQANFLANMSHEIRTPLNGVLGFIDLVLDSKLDKTQRRYLTVIRESAQVLLKLLNDILDLSKVEAGHVEIAPLATDLRRTVRHAVRLMKPIAEQKKIALTVEIDPAFPAAVTIDGGRVRQILLNLLGNALKFTDEGQVSVSLRAGPMAGQDGTPMVHIAVADSGVGIPARRKDAVFGAFVQADDSTSRRFGGSGLGLSISRQFAQLMGGTIRLDSVEGSGTTAELILPLVPATAAEIATAHTAERDGLHGSVIGLVGADADLDAGPVAACGPGRSILLVEDVAFNRELVGEMLRRLGHRVEFAVDGAEAVAKSSRLAADPPAWDLIFMDIQMPVMNGQDAARAIRALGGVAATVPIIALSANAFATEIQQSRNAGMDDHLVKPVGFAELRATVEHWVPQAAPPARSLASRP